VIVLLIRDSILGLFPPNCRVEKPLAPGRQNLKRCFEKTKEKKRIHFCTDEPVGGVAFSLLVYNKTKQNKTIFFFWKTTPFELLLIFL
jgi:hypothetical protein